MLPINSPCCSSSRTGVGQDRAIAETPAKPALMRAAAHYSVTAGNWRGIITWPWLCVWVQSMPFSNAPSAATAPDAGAPQDRIGTTEGCRGVRFGSGSYRERNKGKRKQNSIPRNESSCPGTEIVLLLAASPSFCSPAALSVLAAMPPHRANTSLLQRGKPTADA